MVEGSITIEALLGTNKFDKQIRQLEKHIEKKESQSIEIDAEIKNIREQVDDFNELIKQADLYKKVVEQINERNTQINKERLSKGLGLVDLTDKAKQIIAESSRLEEYIQNNASAMQKLADKGNELLKKQKQINNEVTEYKQKIETIQVEKLKKGLDGVGNSLESSIKKVARLALGIFGLRSAYMALRRASSDLASYDQQYATNLEYIRYALTMAVAPVLRYIVNLAARLLQYINMILNALFGINIFSRGSAESFNKMKAGAGGALKAVKEIKKQLAGFDEINMLTDQSDTGTAGGIGGIATPSFDLSALNAEPPKWLQWIIDNKDGILSTLAGIAGGLAFLKLGEIARDLGLIEGKLLGIKAIGFGVLIKGIIDLITDLMKYIKDPSWENFGKVIKDIGEIILGVGLIIENVPLIVAGAITVIIGLLLQHWETIKNFFQEKIDWLKGKSDEVHEKYGDVIGTIYDFFVEKLQDMLDFADKKFTALKKIFDGIIEFITGAFSGDWEKAFNGLKKIAEGILDLIPSKFKDIFNTIKDLAEKWGSSSGEAFGNAFKFVVNGIISAVEKTLNKPIQAINGLISSINNTVPGVNIGYLSTFSLPRMKRGGILNVPNKGTLVGGGTAIAGEAGHEGYIPLTDQQAMSELGREIGKNVLINLTNITTMNGRVIGRELKQVQSEENFAFNN